MEIFRYVWCLSFYFSGGGVGGLIETRGLAYIKFWLRREGLGLIRDKGLIESGYCSV